MNSCTRISFAPPFMRTKQNGLVHGIFRPRDLGLALRLIGPRTLNSHDALVNSLIEISCISVSRVTFARDIRLRAMDSVCPISQGTPIQFSCIISEKHWRVRSSFLQSIILLCHEVKLYLISTNLLGAIAINKGLI